MMASFSISVILAFTLLLYICVWPKPIFRESILTEDPNKTLVMNVMNPSKKKNNEQYFDINKMPYLLVYFHFLRKEYDV
jgi:hypothetical protein